jgi:hypothetical protein
MAGRSVEDLVLLDGASLGLVVVLGDQAASGHQGLRRVLSARCEVRGARGFSARSPAAMCSRLLVRISGCGPSCPLGGPQGSPGGEKNPSPPGVEKPVQVVWVSCGGRFSRLPGQAVPKVSGRSEADEGDGYRDHGSPGPVEGRSSAGKVRGCGDATHTVHGELGDELRHGR